MPQTPIEMIVHRPLTYLATPYRHPIPAVMRLRFHLVNHAAAKLMKRGDVVFSPISHSHPIANDCELPRDWRFWAKIDHTYLSLSKKMVVLTIPGWQESEGVQAEIAYCKKNSIPVEYLRPPKGAAMDAILVNLNHPTEEEA